MIANQSYREDPGRGSKMRCWSAHGGGLGTLREPLQFLYLEFLTRSRQKFLQVRSEGQLRRGCTRFRIGIEGDARVQDKQKKSDLDV
ncbi:hypothetical protein [Ornithinimicrobium sufpigmenti]|uniref:hypothetical protein n=1 Tax=Ornithinimicrobium sufpigmenti TaxID=2508882 RepID=UPI0010358E99|nr:MULTISPECIES: hypothetical protein [unclassified Ornithinimicrobium]